MRAASGSAARRRARNAHYLLLQKMWTGHQDREQVHTANRAEVAELADAADSKSVASDGV